MDALDALLAGPRASSAIVLRVLLDPPFAIRVEDRAPLALITPVRGTVWITPSGGEPHRMAESDLAVVRGTSPYTVSDHPDSPVSAVILPGNRSASVAGEALCDVMGLDVRTWGTRLEAETLMLVGTYPTLREVSRPLLEALPDLLVVTGSECDSPLPAILAAELARDVPGQGVVLDRMLDLLLVTGLRAWLSRPGGAAPAWYRGRTDPIVGPVLRQLHDNPAHPWTVAELATVVGVSRATLARRFTDLVGEGPIAHLTAWRLALAADLLREPGMTVAAVARHVGYGNAFALSTAFKRVRGLSPQSYRTTHRESVASA